MVFSETLLPYIRTNEPMSAHTTFKTGGVADFYLAPPPKTLQWQRRNVLPQPLPPACRSSF